MVVMAALAPKVEVSSVRTAVTIMHSGSGPALCPFFAKCDGIVVFDTVDGATIFYPNRKRTAEAMCDLLLKIRPNRLVCGFIASPERSKLCAAGIEVRLGSCARPVKELVGAFDALAVA
jgi:hypothetical protein